MFRPFPVARSAGITITTCHTYDPVSRIRLAMKIAESLQSLSAEKLQCISADSLFGTPAGKQLFIRFLPRGQSGFTMIELIVMMIVIGIMAVVVLPRLDLLRGFDEIGYRDKVRATLEYARKSAVAMRRQVRVSVNDSGLTVEFQKQTPELEGTAAWSALNLPSSASNTFAAPNGTSLAPASATIVFDALGRPDAAKSFTVSGGAGTISVEAETGYVH